MIPPESPPQIESKIVFGTGCENCIKLQAENKQLRDGYNKILACDFDDECETKHGLSERYYFVPRSIITQALQEKDV